MSMTFKLQINVHYLEAHLTFALDYVQKHTWPLPLN